MSRIHDALKRAEQERATSTGTHVESAFEQSQVQGDGTRETMPSLQPSAAIAMPAMPTMTMNSAFNYESHHALLPGR
jgi:hypothetical protein